MKMNPWRRRASQVLLAAVGLAYWAVPYPAYALSPSGEALAVVQATSASGPGGNRTLSAAKPIYSGDRITTGTSGEAQIRFADDTRMVVGPNSSLMIDKFVFDPKTTLAGFSVQMTKGAFRFITGGGPKKAYSIQTPTATLGIRGTRFDVAVGRQIGTGILVFDGSVRMCNRRTGRCTEVDRGCGAAIASPDGSLQSPRTVADKAALIRAAFPLVSRQRSLRADFRVSTQGCGSLAVPPNTRALDVRRINLGPTGGGTSPPANGGGGVEPPGNPGVTNPGTSGRTPGGSRNTSNNASDSATSNPGNSENSRAGKKK